MFDRFIVADYNAQAAVEYAHTWSRKRNPRYFDFSNLGGDCTNFISQCLFAGSGVMNYTPVYGWFFISASNRSPAWSGAPFLHRFLTTNKGAGPFAKLVTLDELVPGDVIQLSKANGPIYHSQLVVQTGEPATLDNTLIATHTIDTDYQPLSSYNFEKAYFLHIEGVRK